MTRVTMLGLGSMGRRMAARLAAAGHQVTVWNRSGLPTEMAALAGRFRPGVAAAVDGAELVISMVRDDPASAAVWAQAFPAVGQGTLVVDCSTVSVAHSRAWAEGALARGLIPFDAPVVGSRVQADGGALTFLLGGDGEHLPRLEPVLRSMGQAVLHLGPATSGAVAKLLVNALFAGQVALLAELLGLATTHGLSPTRFLEGLGQLPVMSPAAKAAGQSMATGSFAPQFPVELALKDLTYATGLGGELPMTEQARRVMAAAEAAGHGALNLTAVHRLYDSARSAPPSPA